MRRLAFVLLTSLLVGLGSAAPAHGYWALFHYPHHLPHPHHHHGAVVPVQPVAPVQPITAGQVLTAIQLGQQILGPFIQSHEAAKQPPAPEPRISQDVSDKITSNGTQLNGVVDKTNALLKLVRDGDKRFNETNLPNVPKASAAPAPAGGPAGGPAVGPGFKAPTPSGTGN